MYLKSIEVNGFKSFANKIIFEFPHGITGIVGPNGSGKSNIGDAVRWVLGEQSAKQLRGSKMEDVIFSGTESRKPMGFAYVAITFDNKDRNIALDYDEVKVARRVYRSGESEYLINGSTCRRRDIVEIFYDTGIGKEGYSIIGQGQVEKILSGKIEDSRELFDEAVGIAKYKKNRTLTEKSLDQERDNLDRVTDILSELEKQVGPLERQSVKAKEYLKLREREKEIDLNLFLYDYKVNHAKKEKTEENYQIVTADMERINTSYEKKKEENAELQSDLEEVGSKLEILEKEKDGYIAQKNALEEEIRNYNHTMDKNHLSIHYYEDSQNKAKEEKKEKEELIQEIENRILQEQKDIEIDKAALGELQNKLQTLQEEKDRLDASLSLKQGDLIDFLSSNTDKKEKLSRYITMEEQLGIRNAEYNSRLISLNSELADYSDRIQILEKELKSAHSNWENADQDYQEHLAICDQIRQRIGQLREELDQDRQQYLRNKSRYDTLISIHERYEGYNKSIQHIMEQKKNNPAIIGVVADILTMDRKYETAIEISLGGALQNIVTENEQVAKKMIDFLKRNKYGRATFLPLTSIRKKNGGVQPSVLKEEGVVGLASNLVKTEEKFRNLIDSLLARTVVVDTIDHALFLSKKYNYSLRIVTIGGELLNPGGSITGGAYKSSGNLLGRQREIEEIKQTLKESSVFYKEKKTEFDQLTVDLSEKKKTLEVEKENLDQFVLLLHDYNTQLPELKDKKEELGKRIDDLKRDHKALLAQLDEISVQRNLLEQEQNDQEKSQEESTDELSKLEEEIQEKAAVLEEMEEAKNEKILLISQMEQQMEFDQNEIKRLEGEIRQCILSIEESANLTKSLLQENEEIKNSLEELMKEQKSWDDQIAESKEGILELKESRRILTSKQNKSYQELQALNEELRVLEKEEMRLQTRLEKYTSVIETLVNYMWDNYEITYNYALSLQKTEIQESLAAEYRKEKRELVQSIKKLGNVNVNAIEEFKEVGERYHFMKQQYDDIKVSEAKLVDMIEELNKAMRQQFRIKFAEIREVFGEVFKDLFEGGSASLELMDESNILETGIKIVAQPPGKKLQTIQLLSGGERALTAIALLFAIQNLKPSPFCLLDEIEAALDDVNIERFAKYLHKLSKDTQFIVITHRRGTMNAAEALYGITMQEKGISTLISVDLIDKQLSE